MPVSVVDNTSGLASVLVSAIEQAEDVRIAVAFASAGGLKLIDDALQRRLGSGAHVEFIVGMDLSGTDPSALWALYELSQQRSNAHLYCYTRLNDGGIYHPKLYVMGAPEETTAVIGSSNLTEGGLRKNDEVNTVIRGTRQDEVISDVYAAYSRLKFGPYRVEPDQELLERYQALHQKQSQRARRGAGDAQTRQLVSGFRTKAAALRRPVPCRRDLVGWLETVYDHLPEGEFSNQQIYAFRGEFRRQYPDNQNIEAKVRQQLQVLREMGLVKHLGRGRWKKL